jgi:hypothetical protein
MMVVVATWVNAHAKLLGLSGAILASVGGMGMAAHEYAVAVRTDITAVEYEVEGVSTKLDRIQEDVTEVKCMTITHYQEGDPLDCLNDR